MVSPHTDRKKNAESDSPHAGARMRLRPIAASLDETKLSPGGELHKAQYVIEDTTKRIGSYLQSMRDGLASRSEITRCAAIIEKLETIFSENLGPWFSPKQWGPLKDGINSYQLEMWNFKLSCKFAQTGTTDFEIAPGEDIKGDFKEFTHLRDKLAKARESATSTFEQWWQTRIDQRREFLDALGEVTSLPEASIKSNKAMDTLVTLCRHIGHEVRGFDLSQPASSPVWDEYVKSIEDSLNYLKKNLGK